MEFKSIIEGVPCQGVNKYLMIDDDINVETNIKGIIKWGVELVNNTSSIHTKTSISSIELSGQYEYYDLDSELQFGKIVVPCDELKIKNNISWDFNSLSIKHVLIDFNKMTIFIS
jgi:hypothetical protein